MRILLIEDDKNLSTSIETFFKLKNYEIDILNIKPELFNCLENTNYIYDLYVLDLDISNFDALEFIKCVRETQLEVPIIIMTVLLEMPILQKAFDYGCIEYIRKPFNIKELDIRVSKIFHNTTKTIESNNFLYDKTLMVLSYGNETIELRKKEKLLIDILFRNIGYIVPTENIIYYVWEGEIKDTYPIRQLVNTIRQKLPENIIKTEIGIGYKIDS